MESNLETNKISSKEETNNQQIITETTKNLAKFIQDFEYFPLLESSESSKEFFYFFFLIYIIYKNMFIFFSIL